MFSIKPIIGKILTNSPAEISGLKKNDEILEINNEAVFPWLEIKNKINSNLGLPSDFEIKRDEEIIFLSISPEFSGGEK